jgi:ribonucleoside-diphosphate reductase alpha chain
MKTSLSGTRRAESVPSETPANGGSGSSTAGRHAAAVVAGQAKPKSGAKGLTFEPAFAKPGVHPYDELEWEKRTAEITDDSGKAIFKQENVEVPKSWSVLATKIAVSKYFYGDIAHGLDPTGRPRELRAPARPSRHAHHHRLGHEGRLLQDEEGRGSFLQRPDLALRQPARRVQFAGVVQRRPLSPVRHRRRQRPRATSSSTASRRQTERARTQYEYPQGSACFIQAVEDNMESIMDLARSEAMLFKFGSGTGSDLSTIRSTREKMSGGGKPERPDVVPQGLRPDRQRGEERRQDPPRREDEHPQGARTPTSRNSSWPSRRRRRRRGR